MSEQQIERVLRAVREAGVDTVYLQFTDIPGATKLVTVPAERLQTCFQDGVWFDGSAVEGMARAAEGDLYLHPDPSTFALASWEAHPSVRLICDLCLPDGAPFMGDPRQVLKRAVAESARLGFAYRVASEVEFFLLEDREREAAADRRLVPVDSGSYFGVQSHRAVDLCRVTMRALGGPDFGVETHHEGAAGQHEIDLGDLGAVRAADAIGTLKWALRGFGRRGGMLVSFMPKPMADAAGSGLHIHQTLIDRRTGANAFFDAAGRYALSDIARHFIAGQLAHARCMCAVLAPLVNSYKRLGGGAEAPARISWARVNPGAFIRVPETAWTRAELRAADPGCNPYLALAVMLAAGLDGIKNAIALPEPVEHVVHAADQQDYEDVLADPLPETLGEALGELEWDPVVREALGEPIYERFLAAKEREWAAYRRHVSLWELENYLERA